MSDGTNDGQPIYVRYMGPTLLAIPVLNKGCAFTEKERNDFNLMGLLPTRYETLDEQVARAYQQFSSFDEPINKLIFLRAIQDQNETLFYRLVQDNLEEMMPIIYTPTVGEGCERFSEIYRNPRGLFVSYEERHHLDDILHHATKQKVKVIVVTDGERILGLGDQGIGGMGIPIGKLSLYTACGGISPAYCLPVLLDVGTNNEKLLNDPLYMGSRHKRVTQEQYDEFLEQFIEAVKRRWPNVMIQFEDFAQQNATPLLERYREKVCCFNDDVQGTAAVTVGTLLSACRVTDKPLSKMRVTFVGGGSAGCGIAEAIIRQMCSEGLSEPEARSRIYMVDRYGLTVDFMADLRDFQRVLARSENELKNWQYTGEYPSLLEVVNNAKPDILIGVSGQAGLFSEEVIRAMNSHCAKPIVFPLSNPSKQIEATPAQVIEWTEGRAVVATGSPFNPVEYQGQQYPVPQCNNSYIFPGIGLGVVATKATQISDEMLSAASVALAESNSSKTGALLPPLTDLPEISKKIAFAVGKKAIEQGFALEISDRELERSIENKFWHPEYRPYRRASF